MATRPRRRLALEAVGSTNTVAFEAARSGDPGPLWVTAERQTAGRGRRGRAWVSEAGNLYASLLLIEPAPLEHLQNLPLVTALGVRDGLASLPARPRPDIRIKWPNDILIGGRKAVGILTETERLPDGRRAVVIGCGVNVAHVPGDTPYPVTGLAAEGLPADLDLVFEALAGGVETALDLWDRGQNFAAVRRDWLAHASGLGEACTINLPDRSLKGRFVALDEAGRLLLDEEGGARRAISAGELFLPDRLR